MKKICISILYILCSGITTKHLLTSELSSRSEAFQLECKQAITVVAATDRILNLSVKQTDDNNHVKLFTKSRLAEITNLERNLLTSYETRIKLMMHLSDLVEYQKQPEKHLINPGGVTANKEKLSLVTAFINIQLQERDFLLSGKEKSEEDTKHQLNKKLIVTQINIVESLLATSNKEFYKNN